MSYTKNIWANGDTITAAKLNNMENGIEAAGYDLVIRFSKRPTDGTFSDSDITLVSGSWANAMAKVKAGGFITAACYSYYHISDSNYGMEKYEVIKIFADEGYDDCITIKFLPDSYSPEVTVRNDSNTGSITIFNASPNIMAVYVTESGITLTPPGD